MMRWFLSIFLSASQLAALVLLADGANAASAQDGARLTLYDVKLSVAEGVTSIDMLFDGRPEVTPSVLAAPYRLVLDLSQTRFALPPEAARHAGLVTSFRYGLMQADRSRIIFAMNEPFKFVGPGIEPDANGQRFHLKFSVRNDSAESFRAMLDNQALSTSAISSDKGDRVVQGARDKVFTVVIDPGHGGIDGGATGINGAVEKSVTLAFAKELKFQLAQMPNVRVFLTREDDRFIALDERVRIGRQLGAGLFISLHADTIHDPALRGATVYTLSDEASDEVAHAVAQQENLSDAIGGVETKVDDQQVADILIDLTRRETMQFSTKFALALVDAIKSKTRMINNPHRSAGFKVLKAPDVPSVLVELGYLSNADDEKEVTDPAWRASVLAEMSKAVGAYAAVQLAAGQ